MSDEIKPTSLAEEIESIKKEKAELEQHRKVIGQTSGRQTTEELVKRNPFTSEEVEKLKSEFYRKYPEAFEKKDYNWGYMENKLSETLKERVKRSVNTAQAAMEALERVETLEQTYTIGNPVFYKNQVGLLNKFFIYDEYGMDRVNLEDNSLAKNGDILAIIIFSNSNGSFSKTVLAKNLLPYNESTRLLYDRDKTK